MIFPTMKRSVQVGHVEVSIEGNEFSLLSSLCPHYGKAAQ